MKFHGRLPIVVLNYHYCFIRAGTQRRIVTSLTRNAPRWSSVTSPLGVDSASIELSLMGGINTCAKTSVSM